MSLDESLISYAVGSDTGLTELQRAGISRQDFVDEYQTIWRFLLRTKDQFDATPSADTLTQRFPQLSLPVVKKREVPMLVHEVKKRSRYIRFLTALNDVAGSVNSYDDVDDAVQGLMGELNMLTTEGAPNALVDLFSPDVRKRMMKEFRQRSRGSVVGVPTGLETFDKVVGGLQKQKMYTVIGRPGLGKSWLDLLFMAMAVQAGQKVILYPLEMTLFETATRLYSIFSQKMFGMNKVMRNTDLNRGRISPLKIKRFLKAMEEQFEGRLLVADVGSLQDSYTFERIEADIEMNKPDGAWVDYITLVKPSTGRAIEEEGWGAIRNLSNAAAGIAKRRNIFMGVSAQVNREAIRNQGPGTAFLPRLENIAYGDSIGQDTDVCVSINKAGKYLFYAVVKNRGGPEIGKTRVRFDPDFGHIVEDPEVEADDD